MYVGLSNVLINWVYLRFQPSALRLLSTFFGQDKICHFFVTMSTCLAITSEVDGILCVKSAAVYYFYS